MDSSTFGLKDSPDKQARNSEFLRPRIQEVESERCQEGATEFLVCLKRGPSLRKLERGSARRVLALPSKEPI